MPDHRETAVQDIYDARASSYDETWHPRFARLMAELARPQPGEHVLDLACGTGLVSFNASKAVGPTGKVVGVDISTGMLEQARAKQASHEPDNLSFFCHSIAELETLHAIGGVKFDLITCASALVLLQDPALALMNWTNFLKPGGRLIVDVTHPQNLVSGLLFERVGNILGRPVPWNRLKFQKPEDLSSIMNAAGLVDVEMTFLSQMQIPGSERLEDYKRDFDTPRMSDTSYAADDADKVFESQISWKFFKDLAEPPEVRAKAKEVFREEWKKLVDEEGKVQDVDGVFVGLGWKRA